MRTILLLPLAGLLLAGCASSPSPAQDADASVAGVACPAGTYVGSFTAGSVPQCAPLPFASFSCPAGEAVVGFDSGGMPRCASLSASAPATATPTPQAPTRSIAITSAGTLQGGVKTYTIASASSGMTWGDLAWTVNGVARTLDAAGPCPATPAAGAYLACGPARETPASSVDAGDSVSIGGLASGDTLRVLDAHASAVILTLTVG